MKRFFIFFFILLIGAACGVEKTKEKEHREGNREKIVITVDARESTDFVDFVLMVKNETEQEVEFEFPSSQKYEIVVTNDKEEELYRYSIGKMFTQALQYETVPPFHYLEFSERWNYMKDGERIPPGTYTVSVTWRGHEKGIETTLTAKEEMEVPKPHPSFRHVTIVEKEKQFTISGEVKTASRHIHYVVEDGHFELVKGKVFVTSSQEWTKFTLNILKEDVISKRPLMLLLYSEETNVPYRIPIKTK
ncbi:BsuPI-related putative proteinase inhibitor [Bacillus alveayuensis]|jgi:hypothetical protein|uniref:Intracellular proteinase inhibitor BsuPI domain-containing protein n=1 Tax=Aeribacillus alveayuensis TaxID=279215 RepID=A0ABT9VNG3_9BACI|nr:BsuPI-related putative proteinase inhibitor [Bacillus alveayuensis]MDQ0162410.1 hypothetical protein [Bacillus alveayuensis]